jgi:hypothetical protein
MYRAALIAIIPIALVTTSVIVAAEPPAKPESIPAKIARLEKENRESKEYANSLQKVIDKSQGVIDVQEKLIAALKAKPAQDEKSIEDAPLPPAAAPAPVAEGDFEVDKFDFQWVVWEKAEKRFSINKNQETMQVTIRSDRFGSLIFLTPAEAEAIAPVLAKCDQYYEKLKGDSDKSESVKVGKYDVDFRNSPKYGFSVNLSPSGRLVGDSVSFDRSDAKAVSKLMAKAKSMSAFIDRKIKLN